MPKIEVDESELLEARALKGVIGKIIADPKRRLQLEQLHKEADPSVPTPMADTLKPVNDGLSEVRTLVTDLTKQLADEKAAREADKKINDLQRAHEDGFARLRKAGWTDAGIDGVRKIMEEKGITDHEIAAAYFEKVHPPQQVAQPGVNGPWNFTQTTAEDDFTKKLIETKGNDNMLLDSAIGNALKELRGR